MVQQLRANSTATEQDSRFRPDIEGLRAVAVVAVVLFHAAVPGLGGGYVGVDVFFVISGFLITGLLWREIGATGTVRLRAFYGARARRLLPASAAVGVITMLASAYLLPPLQTPAVLEDGIASALYVSNYRFMLDGVDYFNAADLLPPSPFLHYWSLGVEEQFYLLWAPMFLGAAWLLQRRQASSGTPSAVGQRPYVTLLAVVAGMSFALSCLATYAMPAVAFYSLPTRAWQLALGGLIALTAHRWRRLPGLPAASLGWLGLVSILVSCFWFSPGTEYPGIAALLPTAGAALLIGAGCAGPHRGGGRLLSLTPMRAIGRISYSWYLWHWPVLVLAPPALGHPLGLAERLAAAAFAAGLAWLTLRCLENPVRFAPAVRTSARRSLAIGGVATAIAVCVGAVTLVVFPSPEGPGPPAPLLAVETVEVPAESGVGAADEAVHRLFVRVQASVAASADRESVPSNLRPALADAATEETTVYLDGCMRNFSDDGHPDCATGDTASSTTVALLGDSHAAMWAPALHRVADQRQWRLETLARVGCPLLDLPASSPFIRGEYTACTQWRMQMWDRLRAAPPDLAVVDMWRGYGSGIWRTGFTSYDAEWTASVTRTVRALRELGSRVLVLGPIPDPGTVVPVCLSDHLDDVSACMPERSTAVDGTGIAAESAATRSGGGHYADLTDLFCTPQWCPPIVEDTLVYFDWNHLSHEYSRALAPVIGALADRALA